MKIEDNKYEKQCRNCGTTFITNNKRKVYCCDKCKRDYLEKHRKKRSYKRKCMNCGKVWNASVPQSKFCSRKCLDEYVRKHSEPRECAFCGALFNPIRSNHSFCCSECAKNYKKLYHGKKDSIKPHDKLVIVDENPMDFFKERECPVCHKMFKPNSAIHKYCSSECRKEGLKQMHMVEVTCENCGKKYFMNEKNMKNRKHRCCSIECIDALYRQQRSEFMINQLSNMKIKTAFTKPHQKVSELLDKNGIKHENEKRFGKYCCDIYLIESNLIIEIMGKYWHGDPRIYDESNLSYFQLETIKKDKKRDLYLREKYKIKTLYLWEIDINKNIELCERLIKEYIDKKGEIEFYNSYEFNN